MIYLKVAVAAPLEQTLTYCLTDALTPEEDGAEDQSYIGRRVLVPLGKRTITGYVLEVLPSPENSSYKIRQIIKFLDDYPLFHGNIVPFFYWVANYYHYPLGLVIKAALPGGLSPRSVKKIVLKSSPSDLLSFFESTVPDWVQKLSRQGQLGGAESAEILAVKRSKKMMESLVQNDAVSLNSVIQNDGVREKRETCYALISSTLTPPELNDLSRERVKEYQKLLNRDYNLDLKFSEARAICTLHHLTRKHNCKQIALRELKKVYSGAAKALSGLEEKHLVVRSSERVFRSPFGEQLKHYPRPESLTDEQQNVLVKIFSAIGEKKFKPFLLHGVTGCGKTEVYLRAAEETLAQGRDVIILVPEIALATQLEAHLLSRFKSMVVLLHSGMSAAERFDQFYLALTGRAKIVIGARSALFAPLRDPGLIVVDEEHDASYKQDDNFRYHGRDIAVLRAKFHDAVILLGSATPSITSYAHALSGKYTLLNMKKRVGSSTLPVVTIVDLNKKQSKNDSKRIVKNELLTRLSRNIAKGKQSILLLNRRGFSTALICQDCGTPVQCIHCHVSLTLHKEKKSLICHYCGFSTLCNTVCLECRSVNLVPAGFGTERVEEEVKELLPEARVRRLDSDTAFNRKRFLTVLSEMHDGEVDILIGTQMVAKGHHFPNVTQVGVVWADGGMSMPDFRAAERTFQLITQVTGRAGRGEEPGEVIIQTMRPDHYAIVYARDHQYEKMYEHEMKLRQHPAFPPYVRLTGLRIQGRVENDVQKSAVSVARFCRLVAQKERLQVEILGPAPSPLDKIKDKYRWQVLLKGSKTDELHVLCSVLQAERKELVGNQCTLVIDVDPENMM